MAVEETLLVELADIDVEFKLGNEVVVLELELELELELVRAVVVVLIGSGSMRLLITGKALGKYLSKA